MEEWTLSDEADAAVLVVVLYDNIPSVATLIRSIRPDPKDFYTQLMSARRLVCRSGSNLANLWHVFLLNGL